MDTVLYQLESITVDTWYHYWIDHIMSANIRFNTRRT